MNGQPALSISTRKKASICTEDGKKFTNQSSVDELVRVLYNNEWTLAKIVKIRPANDGSQSNNHDIEIQEGPGKGSGIDIKPTEKHDKMRSVDIIEEKLHEQGNLIDSKIYKLLKQFQSTEESTKLQNKFKDSGESFDFDEMLKCDDSSSTRRTSSLLHTILESNTDFTDAVKKII